MLVDRERQFLSQRRLPQMALIKTRIEGERLILSAPGRPDLELPLQAQTDETLEVAIWRDRCRAEACSASADAWLSDFCKLIAAWFTAASDRRQVDLRYATAADQTAFSDGFPFCWSPKVRWRP